MIRLPAVLIAALIAATPAVAQEGDADREDQAEEETAAGTEAESPADTPAAGREVLETDDQSYLDIEEEDFQPSEEIPTDQSITFPTDI